MHTGVYAHIIVVYSYTCGCLLQRAHAVLCPSQRLSKEGLRCQLLVATCYIKLFSILKLLVQFRNIHSTMEIYTEMPGDRQNAVLRRADFLDAQ